MKASGETYYLEDIRVGDTVVSRPMFADEEHMVSFAREWDPMPIHTEAAAAAASIFGGITASSIYTWGLKQLLIKQVLTDKSVVCTLGFDAGRLPTALHAGRLVHLTITWLDKRASASMPRHGIVRFGVRLVTDRDETVLDYVETVLMRCKPAHSTASGE